MDISQIDLFEEEGSQVPRNTQTSKTPDGKCTCGKQGSFSEGARRLAKKQGPQKEYARTRGRIRSPFWMSLVWRVRADCLFLYADQSSIPSRLFLHALWERTRTFNGSTAIGRNWCQIPTFSLTIYRASKVWYIRFFCLFFYSTAVIMCVIDELCRALVSYSSEASNNEFIMN